MLWRKRPKKAELPRAHKSPNVALILGWVSRPLPPDCLEGISSEANARSTLILLASPQC